MANNPQVPSFDEFVDQELGIKKPSFSNFVDDILSQERQKVSDKDLKWEQPDPLTVARMEGVERSAKPEWWDKFTPLVDRMLGGFYGSASGTFNALSKGADTISKATGLEKSDIFRQLAQAYQARNQYLQTKGMQGMAGDVAAGIGGAGFDIPSIMAFGQWGLPIHGGLMGLAEEGVPGAVKGAARGALTHGTLKGIGELPSTAQLPAYAGFGAAVTPGGVKEKTTGALTWAGLGLTGGKKVSFREFVDRYKGAPKEIQEQLIQEPVAPIAEPTPEPIVEKPIVKPEYGEKLPRTWEEAKGEKPPPGVSEAEWAEFRSRGGEVEKIEEEFPLEREREFKTEFQRPKGKAFELVDKYAGVAPTGKGKRALQKIADYFQVEPAFKRIGAPQTGIEIKAYHSRRNAAIEQVEDMVKDFKDTGLSDKDFQELTFVATKPGKFQTMPKEDIRKFAKPYGKVRIFFNKWKREEQRYGVFEEGFPDSVIRDMKEEKLHYNAILSKEKTTESRKAEVREKVKEIDDNLEFFKQSKLQYVHIPRTWLEGLFHEEPFKARKVLSEFFHERKTLDMEKLGKMLVRKGIIKPEQLDARYVMGAYAHQAGHKIALAKIFRTAEKEGLIKTGEDAPAEWQFMPSKTYPSLKGKKVHPAFADFFERNFTPRGAIGESKIGRFLGPIKLLQFWNPLFLPMYDVEQGWWTASVRSLRTPKNVRGAWKSMKNKDEHYWNMHEWGGFSTPFTPKFDQHMQRVKELVDTSPFLKKAFKNINPYRWSWKIAWDLDHSIRLITYHHYINKGLSPMEAAQLTAKAHGDYASIPAATRRTLNKIFFTPSFKIAMMSAQGEMVTSALKYTLGGPKTPKFTQEMGRMLAGVGTGYLMRILILKQLGFDQDQWGLKFSKEIETDEGKKDLVLHISTPDNVFLRIYHRFLKIPLDENTLSSILDRGKWELHPLWQLAHEVLSNKGVTYKPIYNPTDDRDKIVKDVGLYSLNRLIRITEVMPNSPTKRLEGQKALVKDLKGVGAVLNFFSLPYLRNPKEKRIQSQMQGLINQFNRYATEMPAKTPEEAERRRKKLNEKLQELRKELQK